MRLHQLTVTAFGPFAGTEVVDFDELNDAGLFLLTGATGAGKSSLLDAVCFALYGTVPGVRGVKTLKSQHAPTGVAPEVALDFSVRDRRFVVRRTPEWSRPKKRGDGLLTEKASASIVETTGGVETFHSSRAAEVGLLVNDLMGMTAAQFAQVALLPQGEFQTFLRASSQERHDVLQRLFRTDRFARIEEWVHEHARELDQRASRDRATVQRLVDSIAERTGTETPEERCGDALAGAAAEDQVLPWAATCLEQAVASRDEAARDHRQACERQSGAAQAHDAALRTAEQAHRRAEAARVLQSLTDSEPAAAADRAALEAATRGERCLPLLGVLDEAQALLERAELDRDRVLRRLASVLAATAKPALDFPSPGPWPGDTTDGLTALLDEERVRLTRLETLLPRQAAATEARAALVTARSQLESGEQLLAALTERADRLPLEIGELERHIQQTTARAARREALGLALDAASTRLSASTSLADAEATVTRSGDEHRDARDRAVTARERRHDVAARRLAGMAAELAGRLEVGAPCEVCGSTDHPRPARPTVDHVGEAQQDEAEREVLAATEALESRARLLRDAEHRRDALLVAADGRTLVEARAEFAEHEAALAGAEVAASELPVLQRGMDALRAEQDTVTARRTSAATETAERRTSVLLLEQTVGEVEREVHAATGGAPLAVSLESSRRRVAALGEAHRAVDTAERAAAKAEELHEQTARAVAADGFASVAELRSVLLDTADRQRITESLAQRDAAAARARVVLEETPVASDSTEPMTALAATLAEADARASESARRLHLAEEKVAALDSLRTRLAAALTTWAPLRDAALRADGMSRLVRGIGHDNQLQMRLSAYVLATRLDQVVDAANERLGHMRDQRYLLQRTDRAARKGSQAGLGLEVVDQWTGDARSPVTLSGGETFVVSLSLALGLADVVTQEAGGTEIDTLFVDEGFGTLDADTLDDVMDRLDGLRAGGRTVGVVSHVSELRNRIPTQVHVHKGRSGSSIAVTTLVG